MDGGWGRLAQLTGLHCGRLGSLVSRLSLWPASRGVRSLACVNRVDSRGKPSSPSAHIVFVCILWLLATQLALHGFCALFTCLIKTQFIAALTVSLCASDSPSSASAFGFRHLVFCLLFSVAATVSGCASVSFLLAAFSFALFCFFAT